MIKEYYKLPFKITLIHKYDTKFILVYYGSTTTYLAFDDEKYNYEETQRIDRDLHQMSTLW